MLSAKGINRIEVCDAIEPPFEVCDCEVIRQIEQRPVQPAETGHLLAEGNCGFRASQLLLLLDDLISTDRSNGVVIILDTLTPAVVTLQRLLEIRFQVDLYQYWVR
jgi:hypothetical protein